MTKKKPPSAAATPFPKIPLEDLLPDPENPRVDLKPGDRELAELQDSIRTHGFLDPIIFNTRTRTILGGHQRLKALREEGVKKLHVLALGGYSWAFPDADLKELAPNEERTANVALNRIRGGGFDNARLLPLLERLRAQGARIQAAGYSDVDLDRLRKEVRGDPKEDTYEPRDLPVKTDIKRGDLFKLGPHWVMCGDATDPQDYEALLGKKKVDLLVTDPPYGIDYVGKNRFFNAMDKSTRITVPITGDDMSPQKMHEPLLHGIKKGENILYGWKKGNHSFYGQGEVSVWEIPKPARSELHPTMKPVALMGRAIRNSSRAGAVVLDPFLGAGSTLIACEDLDRICYGIELEPIYVQVCIDRWEHHTGRKAKKDIPA